VVTVSAPSSAAAGAPLVVTDTVKNQGAGPSGPSVTRFYLSVNTVLDASDTLLDGSRTVPGIEAGASSTGSTAVTIPAGTPGGTYYLIAQADALNQVAETAETNNTGVRGLSIGPDLVVSALTVPSTAAPGAVVSVTDTTKNQGTGPSAASVTRFYLSANSLLDASDTLLAGGRAVPALAAGASSTGSTSVTLPAVVATGTYYLMAVADGDGTVAEASEANNVAARSISIGPDLVVSSFSAPTSAASGSTIAVTDTTKNQGTVLAEASTTRFYLSANSVLDAADTLLPASRAVGALAPGATSTGTTSIVLPSGLTPGVYYIIAKADADGLVAETSDSNNVMPRYIQITAGS
jgi:subtilase family serine protease